jgi:hypothetical protein
MSWDENAGRSDNMKIDSSPFERVEEFSIWEKPSRIKTILEKN